MNKIELINSFLRIGHFQSRFLITAVFLLGKNPGPHPWAKISKENFLVTYQAFILHSTKIGTVNFRSSIDQLGRHRTHNRKVVYWRFRRAVCFSNAHNTAVIIIKRVKNNWLKSRKITLFSWAYNLLDS
jgi:hypothetical protein